MTLAHGRPYLAIPGPSVVPDRVLNAMHIPAPNIYEGALVETVAGLIPDLQAVARTKSNLAIYTCNGHGAWEAAASNMIRSGDKVLVLSTGRFAAGWGEVFARLGAEVETIDFGNRAPIDLARVEAALRADSARAIKAVVTVHVDTATSVRNDIAGLRAVIDAVGHPALLAVDCIASLAVDPFEMDAWGVDVMVAASQKGLMTPPGLGFVFFNAKAAAAKSDTASWYWDWSPRANPSAFYEYFGGTAPTHHLLGLRAALDMIAEEGGVEVVWARHAKLARAAWAAFEAWGRGGPLKINIEDPAYRSHAVTALRIGGDDGTRLRRWVEQKAGVTLGIGLGMAEPDDPAWHGYFRLGHMGHLNAHMMLGALGVIEAGLVALDIPHGDGALAAAAKVVAEA
ncbi:MAG TPA: aminotransferase [Rhodobacteraceae bacterium]|nr:aminotransferase [Paracoccaceae bacterium]